MNLQKRKLSQLKQFENNPRLNSDAVPKVRLSIEKYGYKVPIVVDKDDYIVAGHTRFEALLLINEETGKFATVDVVVASDLDDNEVKQFRVVDNQVAGLAKWDFEALRIELEAMDDFVLDDFGDIPHFDMRIAENLLEQEHVEEPSNMIKISVGPNKIQITEAEYHAWASFVVEHKHMTLIDFIERALEIKPEHRHYDSDEV